MDTLNQKPLFLEGVIFSIAISLFTLGADAQTSVKHPLANYEAAAWQTKLLDKPQQIIVAAPPAAAQSKAELKTIKQRMGQLDEKSLAQIIYWDAGAPAYRWNQILPGFIAQKQEVQLRMPGSWMNIAIYNATILAWKEKIKYKRSRPGEVDPSLKPVIDAPKTYSFPCEHSVTAAAAATVMAYFFPEKKDSILALAHAASQSRVDAGLQFPSDTEAGWRLGEQVAQQIIEKAKNDGSAAVWDGKMNKDPKKWTGTYPLGITLAQFSPIVLRSPNQFRPPAPPDFETDMKELKMFKQTFKTRALAFYWANTGETWTELAGKKMFEYRMQDDAPAVARIYAVLTTAYHDAAIAIMDAKYTYWGIRPAQYDTTYKPLIATPPFPGYPSGHAAGAGTSSAVMQYFFPADAKEFGQLAQDCADSRFYAGIHFRTDNETGLKMGRELGKYIVETWMKQ
ncbi:MAG TPA: phosphatase PAP2 family protein [Flavisolibacter sp.]|nr:phosphatase PAP2 family protein [Flavisolibacter sp.]